MKRTQRQIVLDTINHAIEQNNKEVKTLQKKAILFQADEPKYSKQQRIWEKQIESIECDTDDLCKAKYAILGQ